MRFWRQAEKLYNTEFDDLSRRARTTHYAIEPYASKLTQGYEAARLLELYSRTLHFEKKDGWQVYSDRAAYIFEQMNIIPRRASIGIFRAIVKFTEYDYSGALNILLIERFEIEKQHTFIDPMTRLDFRLYGSSFSVCGR